MEIIRLCLMFFIGISNLFLFFILRKIIRSERELQKICFSTRKKVDDLEELIESKNSQPPMKPNNWDSIRLAFKGPVREKNERT